jgi:hypothetical protein
MKINRILLITNLLRKLYISVRIFNKIPQLSGILTWT